MEEVKDKVKKVEALAIGTLEGTANFMEEIKLVELEYKKGFKKMKVKLEELEKQQLLCKYKNELKELKGGEKMDPEDEKIIVEPEFDPKDLNRDGNVSPAENAIYDFFTGIYEAQQNFYQQTISHTQKNSLWTILGSMAFLLVLLGLSVLIK